MKPIPPQPTIAILGGAGEMGRFAVSIVAQFDRPGELIVADLDLAGAEKVVADNADAPLVEMRAAAIDVTDVEQLDLLLSDVDIVLNTTGPFYRFGVPILRAAIAAGCHYLDICDDWEPTIDMLDLDAEAAEHGVLAIIGLGASPGISNMLARVVCERLDRVDNLYTVWPVDVGENGDAIQDSLEASQGESAAIVHWMLQISGEIDVIEHGQRVTRSPLTPVSLDYPGGRSGTAYTVGHPEPLTLADRMNVRGDAASLMLVRRSTAAFVDSLRNRIDAGELSLEDAARSVGDPGTLDQLKAAVRGIRFAGPGNLPHFFAMATGEKDGRAVTVGADISSEPTGMDSATTWPLATGLRQLIDGRIDATGVHPPETVVEPEDFFDQLARSSEPYLEGMDQLVTITTS